MEYLVYITNILKPDILILMFVGVVFGLIFGAIPGLSAPTAIALILPLTYKMPVITAISLLIAVYVGGITGGLVSAILLRIPGTGAAIATTFDGYPMAKNGKPLQALGLGICASIFGGLFSFVALVLISPALTDVALQFSEYEYFALVFFALTLVSVLLQESPIRGFIAMFLGLLITTIGASPLDGFRRYTFGVSQLDNGFQFMSVMIGAFALSEVFSNVLKIKEKRKALDVNYKDRIFPSAKLYWKDNLWNMIRSSCIGTFIGIMPGLGGAPAALMCYAQAKKASKHPEKFGTGVPEGILSVESGNNAVSGGALIPMLTLGIPGDPSAALIMAGMTLHGIEVGPLLFEMNKEVTGSILSSVLVANIFMFVTMIVAIRFFVLVLKVPNQYLLPFIMVFCSIGAFSINNRMFDVYAILLFAIVGFTLEKNGYPLPPFILAVLLGTLTETNFRKTEMNRGSFMNALFSPSIGTVIVVLAIAIPLVSFLLSRRKAGKEKDIPEPEFQDKGY